LVSVLKKEIVKIEKPAMALTLELKKYSPGNIFSRHL